MFQQHQGLLWLVEPTACECRIVKHLFLVLARPHWLHFEDCWGFVWFYTCLFVYIFCQAVLDFLQLLVRKVYFIFDVFVSLKFSCTSQLPLLECIYSFWTYFQFIKLKFQFLLLLLDFIISFLTLAYAFFKWNFGHYRS